MSVYKEIGHLAKEIEKGSVRIYPDAADFGMKVFTMQDPIVKHVKGIMKLYDLKAKTLEYETGATQTIEFDGEWPAVIEAGFEKCTITFVTTRGKKEKQMGYLYVTTSTSEYARKKAREYDA